MSTFTMVGRRIVTAAAGIGILGMGMATIAEAAPAEADPTSASTPTPAGLPIPVLYQPLDASSGLLGISRGSLPAIGTPDLQQLPAVNQLPGFEIIPLPAADAPAPDGAAAPAG